MGFATRARAQGISEGARARRRCKINVMKLQKMSDTEEWLVYSIDSPTRGRAKMLKSDARALREAEITIARALNRLEDRLSAEERQQFAAYYGAHMWAILRGCGYGSMPMGKVRETLDEE